MQVREDSSLVVSKASTLQGDLRLLGRSEQALLDQGCGTVVRRPCVRAAPAILIKAEVTGRAQGRAPLSLASAWCAGVCSGSRSFLAGDHARRAPLSPMQLFMMAGLSLAIAKASGASILQKPQTTEGNDVLHLLLCFCLVAACWFLCHAAKKAFTRRLESEPVAFVPEAVAHTGTLAVPNPAEASTSVPDVAKSEAYQHQGPSTAVSHFWSAGDSPHRFSSYVCAKASRLDVPRRTKVFCESADGWRVRFVLKDPLGDGRCGYRCLAQHRGVSLQKVMQHLVSLMVSDNSGQFKASHILSVIMASDVNNPCPPSAWLNENHLRLLAQALPGVYSDGILVRCSCHHKCDWLWFGSKGSVPMETKSVASRLQRGWTPCVLSHTQHHFALLEVVGVASDQSACHSDVGKSPAHCSRARCLKRSATQACLCGGADAAAGCPTHRDARWPRCSEGCMRQILQYAVCVDNLASLACVSQKVLRHLSQPSFWHECTLCVSDHCSCSRLCKARCVRSLWPSRGLQSSCHSPVSSLTVQGGDADSATRACAYSCRRVNSSRYLHVWMSGARSPPMRSVQFRSPPLLASAAVARLAFGYTVHTFVEGLVRAIFERPALADAGAWFLQCSCRNSELAANWVANVQGQVLATSHNARGLRISDSANVCLPFSSREFACFWNGTLACLSRLHDGCSFPAHLPLHWFCLLEVSQDFQGCPPAVTDLGTMPMPLTRSLLPVSAMRFHCFGTLSLPNLHLDQRFMVFLGQTGGSSPGVCEMKVMAATVPALFRDCDVVTGFATAECAAELAAAMEDLHVVPTIAAAVHMRIRAGRVCSQRFLSMHNHLLKDFARPCAFDLENMLHVRAYYRGQEFVCEVGSCSEEAWPIAFRPSCKPLFAVRRDMPFLDDRRMVDCCRVMNLHCGVRSSASVNSKLLLESIVQDRPWLRGGGRSMPRRTPWADEVDQHEDEEVYQRADEVDQHAGAAAEASRERPSASASSTRAHPAQRVSSRIARELQARSRRASFLAAALQLSELPFAVFCDNIARLASCNYGLAHFLERDEFRESPFPLHLVHLIVSEVLCSDIQLWYVHAARCQQIGVRGLSQIDSPDEARALLALNEQTGRFFVVARREAMRPPQHALPMLRLLDALVFSPAAEIHQPPEDLCFCLGTTRLQCLTVLRGLRSACGLPAQISSMENGQTMNLQAVQQLCLSVLPQLPCGLVLLDSTQQFWRVTWCTCHIVSCLDVFALLGLGSRLVVFCHLSKRWKCAQIRADSQSQWLGSVCPAVGVAHWRNLSVQQGAVAGSVRQMMLGGASRVATVPSIAEDCVPQVGERVMMLKSQWLHRILSGQKSMELRGQRARTGWVWLGHKNKIEGRARVAACAELDSSTFESYREQHCFPGGGLPYARTYALWLEDVQKVAQPVHFYKPWGVEGWGLVRYSRTDLPASCKSRASRKGQGRARRAVCKEARFHGVGVEGKPSPGPSTLDLSVKASGLPNIGNTCFLNAVLQALLHMPDIQHVLQADRVPECTAECLWCLLRKTIAARDAGLANSAFMEQWLPVLKSHDMAAGAQDSALLFADGICSTLRSQQAGLVLMILM